MWYKSAVVNLTKDYSKCKAFFCPPKDLTLTINLSTYAPNIMTSFIKKSELKNNWLLIDAENLVVGRLAAYISIALRGKDKSQYTPHMDHGDFVVVTNIEKIKFTGDKLRNKKYYRHTGHPGGIKTTTPSSLMIKKPEEILKLAVKRMLPGGPLAKKQLSKLKIYKGKAHPHDAQNLRIINFGKINKKNKILIN